MSFITTTAQRSIDEAIAGAPRLIEQCVDHTVTQLQAEEVKAPPQQRQDIAGAWRELLLQRKSWASRFPLLLRTAFETAASGDALDSEPAGLRPSSLSLVDDDQIVRNIETARLAELLNSSLDRPLRELDGLMSAALELPGVQPDRNPLRPQAYAQTLSKLFGGSVPANWPGLWLRHMRQPLAEYLEQLYKQQSSRLKDARVEAASYRLLNTPSGPRPNGGPNSNFARSDFARSDFAQSAPASRPAPLPGAVPTRGASAFAELSAQDLSGTMFQEFLARGSAQAQWGLAPSYYAQIDAEIAAIEASEEEADYDPQAARRHIHVPAVDRPARQVGTQSPLPPEQWGAYAEVRERSLVRSRLKKQARQVGQVLGLEVVRKLVDQVAQDPRLLAPVREAIVALEPSLLRLAMVAPRFFTDEKHPGRRLVERVAERSFKHNDEFSVDFQAFFGPVQQAFAALNAVEEFEDANPFEQTLVALEANWAATDSMDEERQQQGLRAVRLAEQRQAEADQIALELSKRSDLAGVPAEIQDFLFGTWTLVMANARLSNAKREIDPGGFVALVSDLLWSAKPELTLREPARAFELIPRVLLGVRKGLETLGQTAEQNEAFFTQLEKRHAPVLKLRAKLRGQSTRSLLAPAEPVVSAFPDTAVPAVEKEPGQLWLAPRELHAAGFETADPSGLGELTEQPDDDARQAESVLGRLTEGSLVDLFVKDQWRRARLSWASSKGTFFMFVSHGGQPHSMTRRTVERMVRGKLLRTVDAEAVVPRAIQTLRRQQAGSANSVPAALAA